MADFNTVASDKLVSSDDDDGDVSTVDQLSVQTSSESEDADATAIEECRLHSQAHRLRPALEDVLASLPHFEEARSVAEEDFSDDEDAVHRIGQLARRFSSEGEDVDAAAIEECRLHSQAHRLRPALEDVLVALPHFEEARSGAEEDSSEDEDAVHRIGQLARRFALGDRANARSSHRRAGH